MSGRYRLMQADVAAWLRGHEWLVQSCTVVVARYNKGIPALLETTGDLSQHCTGVMTVPHYTTRTCPVCNKEYQADAGRLKHGRQTTCSRACSYKLRAEKLTSATTLTCPVCGKEYQRSPAQLAKTKHSSCCSMECHYKHRSTLAKPREVKVPYTCYRRPDKQCETCGKTFSPNDNRQKYCCRGCFEIAHKDNMRGKKNPSFVDGRSYNKRSYRGEDWHDIRKEVYERDNYTCQVCGVHCIGRDAATPETSHAIIQCHHIEPYRVSQNNDLSNLVTLCISCHGKIHGGETTDADL